MTNPQQPELRRSGLGATTPEDSTKVQLAGAGEPTAEGNVHPVPEENQPGHHPETDQDKPDLEEFRARFSGDDQA